MAVGFSSCSVINNVTMTSLLFGFDFTCYLSSFCLMCTFREIWIPPIILPISMTSDYVTVSIRSCPEVGDADYIIVWKFSGRSVSCFKDMDRGFLESPTPYQSGKQKKKKKKGWIQARRKGGATGALTSLTGSRGPPFSHQSTFLLINYLKQRELILFSFVFTECAVKLKILWKSWPAHSRFPQNIF